MTSVREDIEQAIREYEEEERKRRERELLKEAAKGFAQGVAGATYDVANGATFGGIGKLDKKYFNSTMHKMNDELEKDADVGFVAQNPNNGQTVIKSVYKKDNDELLRSLLEGRRNPSSVIRGSENKPTVPARLSALQQTPLENVASVHRDVNIELEELLEKLRRLKRGL